MAFERPIPPSGAMCARRYDARVQRGPLTLTPLRSWLSTTLADGPVVIDPTIEIDPDTEAGVPVGSR